MSSANDIHAASAPSTDAVNVLRILTGLHAGASRTLAAQEMILVGSGDDCDIVLADNGVSRHHALVNIVGDTASLRALDAPLRVDGAPLLPGDPVELRALQRIQLGDASIAFGGERHPGWATLLPMAADAATARPQASRSRRLPAIAALAVLSLASVAIFAAVMPHKAETADAKTALAAMIQEFRIRDGRTSEDVNGNPVLSGTVDSSNTRDRIQERLRAEGIAATLDLRTGDKIAEDVREVLRSQGLNAKTRYLGDGVVEASGRFEDMEALRAASQSRAMFEVVGVKQVRVDNKAVVAREPGAAPSAPAVPAAPVEPVRIVSIVRNDDPHLVALDGTKYVVGDELPGRGNLMLIGQVVQVMSKDGQLHKIKAQPVTPAELAAAAEKKLADEAAIAAAAAAPAAAQAPPATASASPVAPARQVIANAANAPAREAAKAL